MRSRRENDRHDYRPYEINQNLIFYNITGKRAFAHVIATIAQVSCRQRGGAAAAAWGGKVVVVGSVARVWGVRKRYRVVAEGGIWVVVPQPSARR